MMANWISPGFKVVFLPVQVQPDETTGQDYEQVPRKYDSEDEFEILWFLRKWNDPYLPSLQPPVLCDMIWYDMNYVESI